jgi:hypothetical protein
MFVTQPLLGKIACNKIMFYYQMEADNPASERTLQELWVLTSASRELILFVAAVLVLIYAFWMLSTATVVCRHMQRQWRSRESLYDKKRKNLPNFLLNHHLQQIWEHSQHLEHFILLMRKRNQLSIQMACLPLVMFWHHPLVWISSLISILQGIENLEIPISPRPQIEETGEAQWKFSGAKSISSAQFFDEDQKAIDSDSQMRLQKFVGSDSILSAQFLDHDKASEDLSSLKSIAGETGRKLTSVASSLLADLQDRIR